MIKSITKIIIRILPLAILFTAVLAIAGLNEENDGVPQNPPLSKPAARIDEAIGVMTKGQLCNLTMNYGQISDTRLEDVGNAPTDDFFNFRYPKAKPYGSMCDDFALCFAVEKNSKNGNNGNFIDGYTANGNEDWIAKDGSLGKTHYDGSGDHDMVVYVNGTTPYLAHSDLPQTWPLDDNGAPFWPGYFRRDPATGTVYEDEFVSDRDIYGVFTDGNNQQGDIIGIEIEQMSYCYGRTYAEDFHFYELFLHNTSGKTITGAYFGIYLDPDCSDYGQEILITPAGHTFTDPFPIIMQRDFDGDLNAATNPNSLGRAEDMDFGVIFLETPHNLGITDFHYFTDAGPTYDEDLWPIISSQPTDPDIANIAAEYFHGTNVRIDDLATIIAGGDWVYIAASGPFDFSPEETLKFTFAVVVGDNDADFIKNSEMAIQMFEKGFVGPAAPPGPNLWSVADDQKVTLYWDNSSELKPDPLTGELDFEGYKIYRSQDGGVTWGDEITDSKGSVVGYVPIAQFDLDDNYSGNDPINSFNYLGDNTGLRYMYVDSTVNNGIAYSYTITAYDRGDPASSIPSFETAKGVGSAEKHFITVTPRPNALGYKPAEISLFNQISGKGNGEVDFSIIDPVNYAAYKSENNYTSDPLFKILMHGFPATHFSVYDSSADNKLLASMLPMNATVLPVIDEIGLLLNISSLQKIGTINTITDEKGIDVSGASKKDNTGSWFVSASTIATSLIDARSNDYELRFTAEGSMAYSKSRTPVALMTVPFEVWRVLPDVQKIICSYEDKNHNNTFDDKEYIYIVNVPYPETPPMIGESITVNFPADFPVQLNFDKVAPDSTNPQGGHLPTTGQKVKITCNSSYSDGSGFAVGSDDARGDVILFSVKDPLIEENKVASLLDNVRVVPNPYVVTSLFDPKEKAHSIKFMYLPAQCDISIYSLNGTKVAEIKHDDGTGIEDWNITNLYGQDIAFGVYVYVVSISNGDKKIGKLAIIK